LETFRSDEKLVFVLSANPDTIIRSISQIANDNETKAAIQRFANVIVEGAKQTIDRKPDRDTVVLQTEGLIALLRSLEGSGGRP
jgi:uncharacterized membrane protein